MGILKKINWRQRYITPQFDKLLVPRKQRETGSEFRLYIVDQQNETVVSVIASRILTETGRIELQSAQACPIT